MRKLFAINPSPFIATVSLHPEDISGPGRRQPMARARAIAALLPWRNPGLQLARLADHLKRDLATLIQAAHRIEQESPEDDTLRKTFFKLDQRVRKQVC